MPLPFPKVVRIEPASACNFKCMHCPTGLGLNPNVGIMKMDVFETIIAKLEKFKPFRTIVLYHGGEPLLNPNFSQMVKAAKGLATMVKTVTNGSLLEKRLEDILGSGLDHIEISLDGISPEENNRIRVRSDFFKISQAVKRLIRERDARDLETPKVFISHTQIPERQEDINTPITIPEFLLKEFEEVKESITYKAQYALIWPGMLGRFGSMLLENNECDHIVNTFTIRHNGDVVACCYDLVNKMILGNVLKEDPETIWNNRNYEMLRRDIAEFNPPSLCDNCPVLYSFRPLLKNEVFQIQS